MNIELNNFKCFTHYQVQFIEKGLVLIEGASGVGKSTLVHAILYALKNVGATKLIHKQARVVLVVSNVCKIVRSKNPCRLQVDIFNGTDTHMTLIDTDAQVWLDHNLPMCCVTQGGVDEFLTVTANERRQMLEVLAGVQSELSVRMDNQLRTHIKLIDAQCMNLRAEKTVAEKQLAQLECGEVCDTQVLDAMIRELERDRVQYALVERERTNYEQCNQHNAQRDQLCRELDELEHMLDGHEFRTAQLVRARNSQKRTELLNSLPVLSAHQIDAQIEKLNSEKATIEVHNRTVDKHEAIVNELNDTEPLVVLCPWEMCRRSIVVNGFKLTTSDNMNNSMACKRKRTMEESEALGEAKRFLCAHKRLPAPSHQLMAQLVRDRTRITFVQTQLESIGDNYNDALDLHTLQEQVTLDNQRMIRANAIRRQLQTMPKLHSIVSVMPTQVHTLAELDAREQSVKHMIAQRNKHEQFTRLSIQTQQVCAQYDAQCVKQQQLAIVNRIWQETKSSSVESVALLLQTKINSLLSTFFTCPIAVRVVCWQPANKTRAEKPTCDLTLMLKNRACTVSELSGGERARLSIAISCALCEMRTSHVLILDEALGGLDEDNVYRVTHSLGKWANVTDTLVLVVAHDTLSRALYNQHISM